MYTDDEDYEAWNAVRREPARAKAFVTLSTAVVVIASISYAASHWVGDVGSVARGSSTVATGDGGDATGTGRSHEHGAGIVSGLGAMRSAWRTAKSEYARLESLYVAAHRNAKVDKSDNAVEPDVDGVPTDASVQLEAAQPTPPMVRAPEPTVRKRTGSVRQRTKPSDKMEQRVGGSLKFGCPDDIGDRVCEQHAEYRCLTKSNDSKCGGSVQRGDLRTHKNDCLRFGEGANAKVTCGALCAGQAEFICVDYDRLNRHGRGSKPASKRNTGVRPPKAPIPQISGPLMGRSSCKS